MQIKTKMAFKWHNNNQQQYTFRRINPIEFKRRMFIFKDFSKATYYLF